MAETIISKQCTKCTNILPISEFFRDKSHKDGHSTQCKKCRMAQREIYRKTEKGKITCARYDKSAHGKKKKKQYRESPNGRAAVKRSQQSEKCRKKDNIRSKHYREKYPLRIKANNAVTLSILANKIPYPKYFTCQDCDKNIAQVYHHHKGYAKANWLDVIPLCYSCHRQCHLVKILA